MNPFSFLNNFYSANQAAKLQELLKKENPPIEEVMDEEALVQEYKDNKTYIVNYFDAAKLGTVL